MRAVHYFVYQHPETSGQGTIPYVVIGKYAYSKNLKLI